jgi:hypothetical protein
MSVGSTVPQVLVNDKIAFARIATSVDWLALPMGGEGL